MPAHFMREAGEPQGEAFAHFSDAAQRIEVYTALDYIDILRELNGEWAIDKVTDLNEKGEKARDYLMKLPDRLTRLAERTKIPEMQYKFKWIHG